MRLHLILHVASEGPGIISAWARERSYSLQLQRIYLGESFLSIEEIDFLVLMGGPMNIYQHDQFPWLVKEKWFLKQAIEAGKRVLGICLGAQLLADAMGGQVGQNPVKEIGWFPVRRSPDVVLTQWDPFAEVEEFTAFHWHGDTFTFTEGGRCFLSSIGCANQAILYSERVLGLQFHLEVDEPTVINMIESGGRLEIAEGGPYVQSEEEILRNTSKYQAQSNQLMFDVLDYLSR